MARRARSTDDRAMPKLNFVSSALFLALTAGTANAGGSAGSIGVGAEYMLDPGIGGISMNYDAGAFHVGGSLGFFDGADEIQIGGRFYYHLHSTALADFSLGGEVGFQSADGMMGESETQLFLQGGFQIRAFVAQNVALSFSGGLVIGTVDADSIAVTGQPNGIAGVHYYFF
jgi:hypothetical protein